MKEREYFTFFRSFRDALADMPPESQARLFMAISNYSLDSIEPTLSGIENTIWKLIRPNLDAGRKQFSNGCKGGAPIGNKNAMKTTQIQPKNNPNSSNKEKERDMGKELDEELAKDGEVGCVSDSSATQTHHTQPSKQKQNKFFPPSLQEVKDYISEKSLRIDGESFYAFYMANGWRVGRNMMKSWQMALQYWARKDANKSGQRKARNQSYAHDDIAEKIYEPPD